MTVELRFAYPDAWVPLDLVDIDSGAVVAAQTVLGRFAEPTGRADAERLEHTLADAARVVAEGGASTAFALVPDPPALGVVGTIAVTWQEDPLGEGAAQLVAASVEGRQLLTEPEITVESTPLGEATRCIVRFVHDPEALSLAGTGRRWATTTAVELERWIWTVVDPLGTDIVVAVTSMTEQLEGTPALRRFIEAFAHGISRND